MRKDLTPLKEFAARMAEAVEARKDAIPDVLYGSVTRWGIPFLKHPYGYEAASLGRHTIRRTGAKTWRVTFEAIAEELEQRDPGRAIETEKVCFRETDLEKALFQAIWFEAERMALRDAVMLDDVNDYPDKLLMMPVERPTAPLDGHEQHITAWLDKFTRRLDFVEQARKRKTGNVIRPNFSGM